jgi:hypothetical protein
MYRCPPSFQDGSEITFRSESEDISNLLDPALLYDMVFVDAWHTSECSVRDLQFALGALRPGGTLVVHDCSPARKELAAPQFHGGNWCGVTYFAYVDFLFSHPELAYYTVDSDCGCGVIKHASSERVAVTKGVAHSELMRLWRLHISEGHEMFDFFDEHRKELLNLISVADFLAAENLQLSPFSGLMHWHEIGIALLQQARGAVGKVVRRRSPRATSTVTK